MYMYVSLEALIVKTYKKITILKPLLMGIINFTYQFTRFCNDVGLTHLAKNIANYMYVQCTCVYTCTCICSLQHV